MAIRRTQPPPNPTIRTEETAAGIVRTRTNRVIVKLRSQPGDAESALRSAVEDIRSALPSGRVARSPSRTGRVVYNVDPSADVALLCRELSARADVEYAELDVVDSMQATPDDPRYGEQWALPMVNAPAAWDRTTGVASVLIGIIDSGISMSADGALDHPELADSARFILGTDFVDGGTPRDLDGHGTHVAGIAAAVGDNAQGVAGLAWATQVYICRTFGPSGGSSADFADAVEEIVDYAVDHGLRAVINYSGGGANNQTKRDACQYAHDHGMILCAATGNDYGGAVIYPAAYSTEIAGVIAVGSTDSDDKVSDFSNVGPSVTVVAPGGSILSTTPTYSVDPSLALQYDYLSGTSMATPLVTGVVALMWSRHPSFTNQRIRDALTATAVKLGAGSFDNAWGHGRVDALAAVTNGDLIFPTRFTFHTRFTLPTRFTFPTQFTVPTRFTVLTPWTLEPRFTLPPRVTLFTRFTGDPAGRPERSLPPQISALVRIGESIYEQSELEVRRYPELGPAVADLQRVGLQHLHEAATLTPEQLAGALGYRADEAVALQRAIADVTQRLGRP